LRPTPGVAGDWRSQDSGAYLEQDKLVDMRLLPLVAEGEVHLVMVADEIQQIVHKRPCQDGLSTTFKNCHTTTFPGRCIQYAELTTRWLHDDLPKLMQTLGLEEHTMPLLWTVDLIPRDGPLFGSVEYVASEFNCSCASINQFQRSSPEHELADLPDESYYVGAKLADAIGVAVIRMLCENERRRDQQIQAAG
jgi:hypothetical protein